MNTTLKASVGFGIVLVLAVLVLLMARVEPAFGGAPGGVPAIQTTATTTQVGPQETKTLYAKNDACSSRVIRTQAVDIYLLFGDPTNGDLASTTLSGTAGFTQAASTTVVYDAALYGCGRMTAEAVSSTTITSAQFF